MGWRYDHSVSKSPKELWSFGVLEFGLDFGLRLDFCLTIVILSLLEKGQSDKSRNNSNIKYTIIPANIFYKLWIEIFLQSCESNIFIVLDDVVTWHWHVLELM